MPTDERACVYQCPECGRGIARKLCPQVSSKLVDMGVKVVFWRWPLELGEVHTGAPIGYGDVSAFCRHLERNDWLSELAAS